MSDLDLSLLVNKAEKYIKTAELVIEHNDYDTAVSRTYYAMFYMVNAVLFTKKVRIKTHSGTLSKFSEEFIKTNIFSTEIGKSFTKAFEKRLQGDYDYTDVLEKEEVVEFLKNAKSFVQTLKEYLKEKEFI